MKRDYTYQENEEAFLKYVESCKRKIERLFFDEEDLRKGIAVKNEMTSKGKIDESLTISEAIIAKRKELIDVKINHTMRIVSDASRVSEKIGVNFDFEKVLKVSSLLHDIGRFDQAVYDNNYDDRSSRLFRSKMIDDKPVFHGDYGYDLLKNNDFEGYNIPYEYKYAILQVIRHHQSNILPNDLNQKFNSANQLDTNILSGDSNLTEPEKIVVSALVQMVKDVDMIDILYQNATGDFPVMISSMSKNVSGKSLSDISKEYGVSKKDLIDENGLKNEDISALETITIPVSKITNIKSLEVPKDIQESFYNKENMELNTLKKRSDWSFIVGMWWRLNQFLLKINFTSNLEVIEENKLLETIYAQYPDNFKPLVFPAFEFAKEVLLEKTIKENEGNIYIKR